MRRAVAMADGERELVLVVEDNPMNLMLIRAVLERGGFRTEAAGSAEDALNHLQLSRPALILMDIGLPGRDGLSLARQLKADPVTAGIPIVAVTAYAMHEDRVRVFAAGCDGYITKPISPRTFTAQIEAVLRGRREKQEGER